MQQAWKLSFQLERTSTVPLYRQVADSVADRVGKGLLAPGTPLPGTRSLAKSLGVHRNTAKAAYDELLAGGWISTAPSRGTFVSHTPPVPRVSDSRIVEEHLTKRAATPVACAASSFPFGETESVFAGLPYRCALVCTDGAPDSRLAPVPELLRALRRALKSQRSWIEHDPRGYPGLRTSIAEMLRVSRAIPAEPEEIMVTGGQRMSVYLFTRALLVDRSCIAVEQPGNKAVWQIFVQCGLRVLGVPVDSEGVSVDWLVSHPEVDAVYVTPAHQYPTTVPMSLSRRKKLLNWARESGTLIIEDGAGCEFDSDNCGPLPALAGMDVHASIVHMGPVTRVFSPSIECGFIRASRAMVSRLSRERALFGRAGDRPMEAALFDLAAEGVLRRHLRRAHNLYQERRDHMALCLKREFGNRLRFSIPRGDLAMWLEPEPALDTREWSQAARRQGVRFAPSSDYWINGLGQGGIRIGFASFSHEELAAVASTLRRCLPVAEKEYSGGNSQESTQFRRCIA